MKTGVSAPDMFTSQVGRDMPGRGWTIPLTAAVHALILIAVIVLPLLADETLPPTTSGPQAFFVMPAYAPAPPPPPPPPAAARPTTTPRAAPTESTNRFTAPTEVPESMPDAVTLDLGIEGGVPGGVEGGVPGGVLGGVVGGLDAVVAPPPPPPVRVGGTVLAPQLVKHVAPEYPDFARRARIQGAVVMECTINPQGRVEGVHVVSGVSLFDEAAVKAVQQWVYRPTLLNGVPTPVLLTVTISFTLKAA